VGDGRGTRPKNIARSLGFLGVIPVKLPVQPDQVLRSSLKAVSLALLCTLGGAAKAEFDASRLWVNAGFYSAHYETNQGLRNANPGIGFEYRIDDTWSATAGRFRNSNNANSNYVGAYYQPWTWAGVKLGVVAGAFNGYPNAYQGGWFPAIIPTASLEGQHWGLNVALVPPLKDRLYGAVSFQLKFRFQD
jgi:hypothetical protein